MSELVQVSASLEEIKARARLDFNFFCYLALPSVVTSPFPPFYLAVFALLAWDEQELGVEELLRAAIGLPRGHAKTTFLKLLIAYFIVHMRIRFAVIVCANEGLAANLLADISRILRSKNMVDVYGGVKSVVNRADQHEFWQGDQYVILYAVGWSGGVRGLNIDNKRPDFILLDDAQTQENALSEAESNKLLTTLVGTIFKAIDVRGFRRIVYLGNMYVGNCVLEMLRKNKAWISMVTGAILQDGQPLMPSVHSLESLRASFAHDSDMGKADSWYAEVMNDPQATALKLLSVPLPESDILIPINGLGRSDDGIPIWDGAFIVIDPAGYKKTSDDNVIVVGKRLDDKIYAVDYECGIFDPKDVVAKTIAFALEYDVTLICVEDVGYQATLLFWMKEFLVAQELDYIALEVLKPAGRSKESRIRMSIAAILRRDTIIHSTQLRNAYLNQERDYKIGVKDNRDDLLDAVAYIEDVRTYHMEKVSLALKKSNEAFSSSRVRVFDNNTPF